MNQLNRKTLLDSTFLARTKVQLCLRTMDELYTLMDDEEKVGAESAMMPHIYAATQRLLEETFELENAIEEKPEYTDIFREWQDVRVLTQWLVSTGDRAHTSAVVNEVREEVLDKMTLLACLFGTLEADVRALEVMISAVYLLQVEPVQPLPALVDPAIETDLSGEGNPIVRALDAEFQARIAMGQTAADWTEGEEIVVDLPAGVFQGVQIGNVDMWAPIPRYSPWWGDATLILRGKGMDQTIIRPSGGAGWGTSISLQPSVAWAGRITFEDMTIQCSGANAVEGGLYGQPDVMAPLAMVIFRRVKIVDHPDESIKCVRPISLNQAQVQFYSCVFDVPNCKEHDCYLRNGFGMFVMSDCISLGCGGQVVQIVNRKSEGPNYPGLKTAVLKNCIFKDFHRWPERAGSAVTLASSGFGLLIQECLFKDIDREKDNIPPDGPVSHGCVVVWDSGRGYPDAAGYTNGNVTIADTNFVMKDTDRGALTFDSCPTVVLRDCGVYSNNPQAVRVGTKSVPSPEFTVDECNTSDIRETASLQIGGRDELLREHTVVLGLAGMNAGSLSQYPQPPAED